MSLMVVSQPMVDAWNNQQCQVYINDVLAVVNSTVEIGDTIKIVANSGRKFDTENTLGQNAQPRYTRRRKSGTNASSQFENINNEGTEATHTALGGDNNYQAVYAAFTGHTVEYTPPEPEPEKFKCFTVTQTFLNKLANAKLLVNNVEAILGQDVFQGDALKIQANAGYYFGASISLISASNDYQLDLYFSTGGGAKPTTATATLLYPEVYNDISINIYTDNPDPVDPDPVDPDPVDPDPVDPDPVDPDPEPEPSFTYDSDMRDVIAENNTKFYRNGVILNLDDVVNLGDVLEIKCNSGYVFAGDVKFIAYDEYNYENDILFSVNASGTIATYTVNTEYYISSLQLLTEQTDAIVGSGNIFKITEYQLQQINKDRFYSTPAPNVEIIDYGVNILGVIKLPFDVDASHISGEELIRLGSHVTTVSAPKIETDKLVLNLGDVEVAAPSSLLDYSNARVLLHLPFAPTMTLDIDYVLGYVINIEYIINLYSGNAVINVKSSKTDKVIATGTVDLGVNIPFSSDAGYSPASNNTNVMMGGDNHVRSPFIEINRNIPLLADKFFTVPVIDESTLSGNVGFIRVDEINLNVSATSREKELIVTALKSGVIIK